MKFENVPLGFDEEKEQWKLHVCCHTCGEVGQLFCFNDEWAYKEQIEQDFPCTKCFYEQEIQKVRDGTSDLDEGMFAFVKETVLKEKGISVKEQLNMVDSKREEIDKEVNERVKVLPDDKIQELIQEEIDEGNSDFEGEVCKI